MISNDCFVSNFIEGHPSYLSDNYTNNYMGAIISSKKKKELLPLIQKNLGKLSQREIARKIGIGKTTINRWSSELGFQTIKYTANESFFRTWSYDMSYILGYIFADGNINWKPEKSYRSLTITASEKDKTHLENVRNVLKSTKPLLYSPKTKSYRLIINSKELCLDLMKFGIYPRKSLSVKFPKIPRKFLKDFIRGIIDGDGNVRYVNRKKSPYFEITISSGSFEFCKGIVNNISSVLGIDANIRNVKANTLIIQYSCRRGLKLAEWIYDNPKLFLERKFQQYNLALCYNGGDQS